MRRPAIEPRKTLISGADAVLLAEGNTYGHDSASVHMASEVEVIAYNGAGLLANPPLQFKSDAWGPVLQERPRLFVLAMGVDKYAQSDWQLRYATKDASAFAEIVKAVAGATSI
jgi:hypothetical protein